MVEHIYDPDRPVTAFGDLRVAELTPLLQFSFEYTVSNTELIIPIVTNGGTVTQSQGMAVCTTSTTTASKARIICHQHIRYSPGLGGLFRFTGLFTAGVAGTSQWIGLLSGGGSTSDFLNGFAIGYNGAEFGIVRFQNDVTFFTPLSECDDPLDGRGNSGVVLDPTKLNVFEIRYQYLGGGGIEFAVEHKRGYFVTFHTIMYAGSSVVPSIFNPNLHLTIYADNKSTTENIVVKTASFGYFVEGKSRFKQIHQYNNNSEKIIKGSVGSPGIPIFTIRNRNTYESGANLISVFPERVSLGITTNVANNQARWKFVKNASVSGANYNNINTTNSLVELDVSGTSISGGKYMFGGIFAGQVDKLIENISDYEIMLHPNDTLTLFADSNNTATINGEIMWKELF